MLSSLSRHHNNPLAKCGGKKHCMDFHGDHTSTCTAHSGATKAHDWLVGALGPHGWTHGPHAARRNGKRRPTARRRGDPQLSPRRSGPPEPGLRPVHDPRLLWEQNQNISFLPAVSTSTRMHGEFLRLLFLQAHRETEAHLTATGMSSQRNQSDSFRFKVRHSTSR